MADVNPIPDSYPRVTPYLCVDGAAAAIDFSVTVFGATERMRMPGPELRPVADQFYGDRSGQFEDPFGHRWSVASHVEDVSPEEMSRRAAEAGHTSTPAALDRTKGVSWGRTVSFCSTRPSVVAASSGTGSASSACSSPR